MRLAGVDPVQATNEATNAREVNAWHNDPPVKAFVYVRQERGEICTWMGTMLGTIVSWGKPWRSNMGDMRQSIKVRGTNGRDYYGTYFCSAGDYARLTLCKAGVL